jgi:hypothetical protein
MGSTSIAFAAALRALRWTDGPRAWVKLSVLPHALLSITLGAQSVPALVDVRSSSVCPQCRLEVRVVQRLGKSADPVSISTRAGLIRDDRGRLYAPSHSRDQLIVYDSTGVYQLTVGGRGVGPGEYQEIADLARDSSGRIYVTDHYGRVTVLNPDHKPVKQIAVFPIEPGGLVLSDGTLIFSAVARSPQRVGFPIHVVGPEGRLVRSFGETGDILDTGDPIPQLRKLASARDGGLWVAHLDRYVIEHWTLSGRRTRIVRRQVDWLPSPPRSLGGLRPIIRALREDEDGRLWVVITIPNDHRPPIERDTAGRPLARSEASRDADFQTIIEVLDPQRGAFVAATRLPGVLRGFVMNDHLYRAAENWDGDASIEVLRVRLTLP